MFSDFLMLFGWFYRVKLFLYALDIFLKNLDGYTSLDSHLLSLSFLIILFTMYFFFYSNYKVSKA